MDTTTTTQTLTTGTRVRIVKGCQAREITNGSVAEVEVYPLGKEYGYSVKVTLIFYGSGRVVSFYARHPNRLSDPVLRMNDGNPLHTIEVRLA
jgi:hypothetical protein